MLYKSIAMVFKSIAVLFKSIAMEMQSFAMKIKSIAMKQKYFNGFFDMAVSVLPYVSVSADKQKRKAISRGVVIHAYKHLHCPQQSTTTARG